MALDHPAFTDEDKEKLRVYTEDRRIMDIFEFVRGSTACDKTWERLEHVLACHIADGLGLSPDEMVASLARLCRGLVEDEGPEISDTCAELCGKGQPSTNASHGVKWQPQTLEVYKGVVICRLDPDWRGDDGGVYVGRGDAHTTKSVFCEAFRETLDPYSVTSALSGRPLYVLPSEVAVGREVIDRFGVRPGNCWNQSVWKTWLGFWLDGRRSVSVAFVGLVLKVGLRAKPGQFGNFLRILPACARKQFKPSPVELLPVALPVDSHEEIALQQKMMRAWESNVMEDDVWHDISYESEKFGIDVWCYLQLALVNFLWCGSGQVLGQVLPHPAEWTAVQQQAVDRFRRFAALFVEDRARMDLGSWEVVRQELGDMYTGHEIQKAYKVTWKAIAPHVPGPGEAGRIDLAESVDPSLRPFVEDPELLRIPDQELGEAPLRAPVLVESDQEYDLIVERLVEAGMFQREVEHETLLVKGEPVYNGLFGVHKSWKEDGTGSWFRTLRLIINLIPANRCQSRMPLQPSASMGYAPLWGSMTLLEDEVILAYAEDVRHCFHIFAPSPKWRGYFVLNKSARGSSFKDGCAFPGRPRVKSAPMGWSNIVDFVQSSLERMGTLAGVPAERVVRMGEPLPLLPLVTPREYFSFYVDNFDSFKVVATTDKGIYEGRPSDTQMKLREVFHVWGVERDANKSAEGLLDWSSLGAEQLGEAGLLGSSRKLRRAVAGAALQLLGKEPGVPRGSKELLSVVGKAMHSIQFCRPLACLFDCLYREINTSEGKHAITITSEDELLMIVSSLPMHWMDQRMTISPTVYATDASPDGGGACCSSGLSARGRAKCRLLCSTDDLGGGSDAVVLVEAFGGIGGLRKACELLGILPQGVIFIEMDQTCIKLARRHCPYVLTVEDIRKVTYDQVLEWRRLFPRTRKVILGGGWPCVNHSRLNATRKGAAADSSRLLDNLIQIRSWLKQASGRLRLPDWDVLEVFENVVMDEKDLQGQTALIGYPPMFAEAGQVLRCRRPRLWWIKGVDLIKGLDLRVSPAKNAPGILRTIMHVQIDTERPGLDWFLRSGAAKLDKVDEPFFSFCRPQARASPPASPAGLYQSSEKALGRWKGDAWRLAPYHYQDSNLVRTSSGVRRLLADEQLRMLGFHSDHLELKTKLSEDQRQQMVGNTWPALLVARLLAGLVVTHEQAKGRDLTTELWQVWKAGEDKVRQIKQDSWSQRFGRPTRAVRSLWRTFGLRRCTAKTFLCVPGLTQMRS